MTHPLVPTAVVPVACYGVCCPQHQDCQRYLSIDRLPAGVIVIGFCGDGGNERPLFVAALKELA